jgi:hypothetical protein
MIDSHMKHIKDRDAYLRENSGSNEVAVATCDWKQNLDAESMARLRKVAEETNGMMSELDVKTIDSKLFVAGPPSLFAWLERNDGNFGEDYYSFFIDCIFDQDTGETIDEAVEFYMHDAELYVVTASGEDMPAGEWWEKLEAQG